MTEYVAPAPAPVPVPAPAPAPAPPPAPPQTTTTTTTTTSDHDVLLYFIAIFLPPLAVFFKRRCSADLWINIALWILGWIPGVVHACWIINKY